MSEILRKPERLRLQGICKIPAGKAGKAAAKQYANERKARIRALAQLATADSKAGIGLLVMLNSADRGLGRYIFKKLDKVIPFYVRALSDGTSGMPAEEMSWLMDACEKRGYRTLWLDLAGTEKIDKKAVLHLVAGELMRVLEAPAPERTPEEALGETLAEAEVEPEAAAVEESTEPEMAEATELAEHEAAVDEPDGSEAVAEEETATSDKGTEIKTVAETIGELQEETIDDDKNCASEKLLTETVRENEDLFAEKESQDIDAVNAEDVIAEPKAEDVKHAAESPVTVEDISAIEENPVTEETLAAEVVSVVEENPVAEEKPAAEDIPVVEEKPAPRRRSRKTSSKAEGEKAPAKPRRKREPAAPLTVEATLAKRRRQMGLE